jgi:hypothetical protein
MPRQPLGSPYAPEIAIKEMQQHRGVIANTGAVIRILLQQVDDELKLHIDFKLIGGMILHYHSNQYFKTTIQGCDAPVIARTNRGVDLRTT